ncbi:uncharacterized protein BDW43DRAFT_43421 [Aspergillus alliaceus]|uniref:uncharacterized protein n=1 Tax=Petromyces alliaceus TaxID=209559 RepID=UPI0012A49937|nr:uncharacterized protein BDW43DRAFT_43421 [Aspergillus alliaceus]KAB8235257.1 hypothetical protein BDW43DRAFT_43421 [Aspergillus alliaceus]
MEPVRTLHGDISSQCGAQTLICARIVGCVYVPIVSYILPGAASSSILDWHIKRQSGLAGCSNICNPAVRYWTTDRQQGQRERLKSQSVYIFLG